MRSVFGSHLEARNRRPSTAPATAVELESYIKESTWQPGFRC